MTVTSDVQTNNFWFDEANCIGSDVELFFPDRYTAERDVRAAKKICKECSVVNECLSYALETDSLGIWAGTDEKERSRMRIGPKR